MKHAARNASLLALVIASLAGCAGMTGNTDPPYALILERTGATVGAQDSAALQAQVHTLLATPLTEAHAVQIALINNPGLLASYADFGVAQADLLQAGLPDNPGITFNHTHGAGATVIDRTWSFNLISLITAPLATRIERSHLEQTRLQIADYALRVAASTRAAYFEAIAAQQDLDYAQQVNQAAQASAELAQRMRSSGNWSALDQQREQLFFAQTSANLAMAGTANAERREALNRLLGLSGSELAYQLPSQLPDLPESPFAADDIEALAMAQRLDIQMSLLETRRLAASLDLTQATGFINVLEAGPANNSTSAQASARGYQISIEIPLFDWGQAKTLRAQSLYMQSVQRARETALNARAEVRLATRHYQDAYRLARQYRDQIVPLQSQISAQNLLRYNGMLISVFELLSDARNQVAIVNASAAAMKNFWVADAQLQAALGGNLHTLPAPGAQP